MGNCSYVFSIFATVVSDMEAHRGVILPAESFYLVLFGESRTSQKKLTYVKKLFCPNDRTGIIIPFWKRERCVKTVKSTENLD